MFILIHKNKVNPNHAVMRSFQLIRSAMRQVFLLFWSSGKSSLPLTY